MKNYREDVKCCASCYHIVFGYEGECFCSIIPVPPEKINRPEDEGPSVEAYGICDEYKERVFT